MTNAENIEQFIPQRPPFVMVDQVLYDDELVTRTSFLIKDDNIFLENGRLEAAALVENIAQTAAAGAGYKAVQQQRPVQVGFIGAIKGLVVLGLPSPGQQLTTETRLVNTVFNVSIVEGKVCCGDAVLATCEMKIFLQA
ncbi:3-hydroxyacyl-ACP dehydratase [Flavihumibacter fluvii]|uniref:3-hydroxyacyl-ACP dehydratase n=1 Tax=Flavihumibacter fluvii TaxID=2838157 RepID=UPI001BDEED35|nr:3-hydroxyacyl-ACP dehydratase [Flavihumibacter fluvii]ULQ51479.1 3-hydroxyacyl-ACP dehydratase [Flavihumibacter fluvii]